MYLFLVFLYELVVTMAIHQLGEEAVTDLKGNTTQYHWLPIPSLFPYQHGSNSIPVLFH